MRASSRLRVLAGGHGDIPVSVCIEQPGPASVEDYQALGIHRAIFLLPSAGPDQLIPLLDRYATLAAQGT